MSTHHNQAIGMASAYLEHGTDPLLRQIAGEILAYQASEIGVMNQHLGRWSQQGPKTKGRWSGWGSASLTTRWSGCATTDGRSARTARGTELDQLFTRLMIEHHLGGIHMAK